MKYIRIQDAQLLPQGWQEACQNVPKAFGVKQPGWVASHAFRIGARIYYFKGGEAFYTAQRLARGTTR